LLHTFRKQFDQSHPTRHPTRAAIETARQLLQPIAEASLQFHQQPAFFQRGFVVATTHGAIQKQSLRLVQRPDHHLDRVPAQLLERRDPLVAVDDQVTIRLLGCNHYDRRLLSAGRKRRQQPPLTLRPAHSKVLQTPLKLMKFQPHVRRPLDSSTLHQVSSGIARQHRVVPPDLPWNQHHKSRTGIARSAAAVHP
jgi:hypothetical protein